MKGFLREEGAWIRRMLSDLPTMLIGGFVWGLLTGPLILLFRRATTLDDLALATMLPLAFHLAWVALFEYLTIESSGSDDEPKIPGWGEIGASAMMLATLSFIPAGVAAALLGIPWLSIWLILLACVTFSLFGVLARIYVTTSTSTERPSTWAGELREFAAAAVIAVVAIRSHPKSQ